MKTFANYLTILLTAVLSAGCSKDNTGYNAEIAVEIYENGDRLNVNVNIRNANPNDVSQCGLYWVSGYGEMYYFTTENANHISTGGGQRAYTFEIFPWDGMSAYFSDGIIDCNVGVRAYAYFGDYYVPSEIKIDKYLCPVRVELDRISTVEGSNLVVNGSITAIDGVEVIERGVYWTEGTKTENIDDYNKITAGSGNGNFSVSVPVQDLTKFHKAFAYATTNLGTVYSVDQLFNISNNLTVSIRSDYSGLTHEKATMYASCRSDYPELFPVLERGFCYVNMHTTPNVTPTIHNETFKVEPGMGDFTGTLRGLSPGAAYKVRAYVVTAKETRYSPNYVVLPLYFPQVFLPNLSATTVDQRDLAAGKIILNAVTYPGEYPTLERGFCYTDNFTEPFIDDNRTVVPGTVFGNYNVVLENLPPGTYVFKAYAINEVGIGYSQFRETVTIP